MTVRSAPVSTISVSGTPLSPAETVMGAPWVIGICVGSDPEGSGPGSGGGVAFARGWGTGCAASREAGGIDSRSAV